ncbi:uncharacterized protein LOC116777024 isoform X2 [Danaus plexippus]|uniref:uncharacterized protein LOC116777024 isoform X2 n=1 Tax=Danaus plexippus TaxID=13037 RepID=UPI0013C3E841|nr:uncharacterized protein LOC116777024 isoform X2 [Danaus plexippus]
MRSKDMIGLFFLVFLCFEVRAKSEEKNNVSSESKFTYKNDGQSLLFADEFKQVIERYMFGICPQSMKSRWLQMVSKKNGSSTVCDLDADQRDLAGRLATLSLRAHSVSRGQCSRLGTALAAVLADLASVAQERDVIAVSIANEKKRKLSKSQKAKIQAKQRTALAVKKKAAAAAAAAAAKMAAS